MLQARFLAHRVFASFVFLPDWSEDARMLAGHKLLCKRNYQGDSRNGEFRRRIWNSRRRAMHRTRCIPKSQLSAAYEFHLLDTVRMAWKKPFQPRDMLQEKILKESGAPQSWLKTRIAGIKRSYGIRTSPLAHNSTFGKTWEPVLTHDYSCQRQIISALLSSARELITADSWVCGTWLHRKDWLGWLCDW